MISGVLSVPAPEGFWEPIRRRIVGNILGSVPSVSSSGKPDNPPRTSEQKARPNQKNLPIITYISRQGGVHRRLSPEAHEKLVEGLRTLEKEGLAEVRIPAMERMSLAEQIAECASSTVSRPLVLLGSKEFVDAERQIILGVHGNGLTHQLFMPVSKRSAVIEMVIPGGKHFASVACAGTHSVLARVAYIFDYWMLAVNLGHKHYLVRNDEVVTYAKGQHNKVRRTSFYLRFFSGQRLIYTHHPSRVSTGARISIGVRSKILTDSIGGRMLTSTR